MEGEKNSQGSVDSDVLAAVKGSLNEFVALKPASTMTTAINVAAPANSEPEQGISNVDAEIATNISTASANSSGSSTTQKVEHLTAKTTLSSSVKDHEQSKPAQTVQIPTEHLAKPPTLPSVNEKPLSINPENVGEHGQTQRQRQKAQQKGRFFVQSQSSILEEGLKSQSSQQLQYAPTQQQQNEPSHQQLQQSQNNEQQRTPPQQQQQQYHQQPLLSDHLSTLQQPQFADQKYQQAQHSVSQPQMNPPTQQHQFQQQQHHGSGQLSHQPVQVAPLQQPRMASRQQSLPNLPPQFIPRTQFVQPLQSHEPAQNVGTMQNPQSAGLSEAIGSVVTKKKGRFNFLEQAPVREASPGRLVDGTDAAEGRQHERSFSATSAPGESSIPLSKPGSTNDAAGAPVVKKKGRFVVTSVPAKAVVTTTQSVMSEVQTSAQSQAPSQIELGYNNYEGYTTTAILGSQEQLNYAAAPTYDRTMDGTQAAVQPQVQTGLPSTFDAQQPPPPTPNRMSPVPMVAPSLDSQSPSTHRKQSPLLTTEESGPSTSTNTAAQQNQQSRTKLAAARSTPGGIAGQQGFGKMYYFLDQMKLEVTDADKNIKSLQTDMKCMVRGSNLEKSR